MVFYPGRGYIHFAQSFDSYKEDCILLVKVIYNKRHVNSRYSSNKTFVNFKYPFF